MEESGFLAETLDNFKDHLRTNYPKHYDAAIVVNTYAQKLQYKIEITKYHTGTFVGQTYAFDKIR